MPHAAVHAHRLLGDVAGVRMALHLLESDLPDEQRAQVQRTLHDRLDALESGLRELITAPRESLDG